MYLDPDSMFNYDLTKACENRICFIWDLQKEEEQKNKFWNFIYALAMKFTDNKV